MEHNPVSMGDVAYGAASSNEAEIKRLRAKIAVLEAGMLRMAQWSEEIATVVNNIADHVGYDIEGDSEFITED